MNSDPLKLNEMSTPEITRSARAAPLPEFCNLHRRLMKNECADSLETKIMILAHMFWLAYTDIKEHTTP